MAMRWGFFFLALLTVNSSSADARNIANIDVTATKVTLQWHDNRDKVSSAEPLGRNIELCILCTSFTAQATQYLSENKSQTEIIENLHQSCSELMPFQEQCNLLVDYYAPLFFIEIANIDPKEFCTKVNLCEESKHLQKSSMLLQTNNQSCSICHDAIDEILNKMSDPDTEIKIIELLLKECGKVQHHVQQCKRLVITYAPLILINGEKFLRKTDICAEIHACEPRALVTTPLSTITSM